MSASNIKKLIIITWEGDIERLQAERLASRLHLPLAKEPGLDLSYLYCLNVTSHRLELISTQGKTVSAVYTDFIKGSLGYRAKHGGRNQSIVRAVGLKTYGLPLNVWDVTAGFGRDAFVLASMGCSVYLIERSTIIGALLQDGLERAEKAKTSQNITKMMRLTVMDAKKVIKQSIAQKKDKSVELPDVVYLDPMFPEPLRNKSALVKIEMRMVRDIVGPDVDAEELLTLALKVAKKRVVVKRPIRGSTLSKLKPSFVVAGKTHRYDIYQVENNPPKQ